jgi:transcriptional regulator with XRE-family HTH domain
LNPQKTSVIPLTIVVEKCVVIFLCFLHIDFMTVLPYNIEEHIRRRNKNMANIIGKNIKALRDGMGFNQSNIARFLNVDQSLISKVEKGERSLSSDMLEKLACLFGISVDDIESSQLESSSLSFAFRASDLTAEDMEAISAINRIALNSEYMGELLKGERV